MRRNQQSKILEMLETLDEAHYELQTRLSSEIALELLADCQSFALKIGEFIEGIKGEGTKTVSLLEEYCELVYQASMDADSPTHAGKLDAQLALIENMVRSELKPDKVEAVFFPYQLSMWDSLESIYLAAREDPECDAYVVPIPWFEKNPDESFGKMHYDGDSYPENIPVIDWTKYDVEERRPDIAFIHNPYDSANSASSVPPDFYTDRLMFFSGLLCYCPYFVTYDDISWNFALSPGAFNADRIIAQSEKVRASFIREIDSLMKEYPDLEVRGGDNLEKKVVALGSPKFDKVLSMTVEDFSLPDSWRRLIEKPDGSRKNTVLYNTSVTGFLNDSEKMLNKMRHTFSVFRNRDDAILWWRPHPLSIALFGSTIPGLAEEYGRLVDDYKCEGFGIYDDTPDFHRSLKLSGCLYGDATSLVALYQCMEKPVLIHDIAYYGDTGENGNSIEQPFTIGTDISGFTKSIDYALKERPGGMTLERLLDILELPEKPDWYTGLLKKQREYKFTEIANPDGKAGEAVWEHCKAAVMHQ